MKMYYMFIKLMSVKINMKKLFNMNNVIIFIINLSVEFTSYI